MEEDEDEEKDWPAQMGLVEGDRSVALGWGDHVMCEMDS